jgi:RNA polymerase sigma-70 factor (ECF subfamily)
MNVTIDWLRKKQVSAGTEFDDTIGLNNIAPGAVTTPHTEDQPDDRAQQGEIQVRIDRAISKLSPEHRAVILMKEVEGLQYHEIAECVGCSIGTVMSRLFYARKKLQTLLRDVYENL